MSENEKDAATPSEDGGNASDETAETAVASGAGTESIDSEADTLADTEEPSAGASADDAPAGETEEKEEKKVAYELLEATPRAGSIVDLKIKVPYSEYDGKTREFYKELRNTVIIDGFRRGKAPLKLIQNRYHKQVKQDALDFLLDNCVRQIVKEKGYGLLRDFDRVDPEVADEADLEFAISLEVRPKIDPVGYDGFELTVDTFKVDETAVDAEIEKIRRRHATFKASDVLTYEPGHGVTVDIRVTDDKASEIEDLTRKDLFLAHPDRSLPEPVVAELRGKGAGESFTVQVPNVRKSEGGVITSERDNYFVKVREIKREVLPDLDDQFATDLGLESLEALRAQFRELLTGKQEREVRDEALDEIYTALIEKNEFELPETLVREAQGRMLRDHEDRLSQMGLRLEDLGGDPKEYVVRTRENAERLLRVMLLNQAISEKEKIEAGDADVEKAIKRRAEEEGRRPLAIRAHLEAHKLMDQFREDLKYELVNDFLLGRAKIDKQYVSPMKKIDAGR